MEIKLKSKIKLKDLPPGSLFLYGDTMALKSEYRTEDGGAIESYIVGSGEMFWGGTSNPKELEKLEVFELEMVGL